MSTNIKITVIIVNWNGYIDTIECLQSLQAITYPAYEIVVVDNGSTNNSVTEIQKKFPKQLILETKKNLGFAGGNNVGIMYALENGAEQILLLNNDTVVEKDFLKNLVDYSISHESVGVVGPLIYYFNEREKFWWQGGDFDFWFNFRDWDFHKIEDKPYESPFISGCALLIKKEVIEKIGLLDERFFLYYEDADWCYRAIKEGYKCFIIPESRIWHKVSASSGASSKPENEYYFIRNKLLFAFKNISRLQFIIFISFYTLKFLAKSLPLLLTNRRKLTFHVHGFLDFFKQRFGIRDDI